MNVPEIGIEFIGYALLFGVILLILTGIYLIIYKTVTSRKRYIRKRTYKLYDEWKNKEVYRKINNTNK